MNVAENSARPEEIPSLREDADKSEKTSASVDARERRLGWETYLRCFFLMAIISGLGFLSWRPGLLRLHMLASLANPSRGESLAWKPNDGTPVHLPEIKRTKPPGEWRLTSAFSVDWHAHRPAVKTVDARPGNISLVAWRRFSDNPWTWRDDSIPHGRRRIEDADSSQPPQKPTSSVRVGNIPSFPAPALSQTVPGFPGLRPSDPILPAPAPLSSVNWAENGISSYIPPLPVPSSAAASRTADPQSPPQNSTLDGSNAVRPPAAPSTAQATTAEPVPARILPDAEPPTGVAPPPASASSPASPEIDWKNREITSPIPDAYLTIYPKLKFIGLCVPGQGYIRKYNQIGAPADVNNPKMHAQDGRTPYGRYYLADRNRDADGARLYLSWPSPEDAERIGLQPQEKSAVEAAWQRQGLPPQNTRAGGGIAINGLRQWVETTEGGFTLEEPHMEEIFTALPNRAWVFIQP